jgi:hypothetical protein
MKPQSNPVAGFYPINNLRIMPENSNCSSLWTMRRRKARYAIDTQEGLPDGAVDKQCGVETIFSADAREQKKEVAHLLRHQRSEKRPGWGKVAIAPSHLHIASSIAAIFARCP